jgi:omega-hydroxy-beta-dihydromenaquinone-9 sulfotransferase
MSLKEPIILISTGRAGSTVISEILFRNPEIGFPSNYNEKFPGVPSLSLVRNFFDNKLFRKIGIKKQQYNSPGLLNKFFFTPSEAWSMWEHITGPGINFSRDFFIGQKADAELAVEVREYFQGILFWQNRNKLAFKITGPSRIEFLLSIFPDARFIRIKRDPFATVYSFLNAPFWKRQGINQLWWLGAYTDVELSLAERNKNNPLWMTAFQVKKVLEITDIEISQLKPEIIELQFEEFVADPIFYTKELFGWLGLECDNYSLNYFKEFPIRKDSLFDRSVFSNKEIDFMNHFFNDVPCTE